MPPAQGRQRIGLGRGEGAQLLKRHKGRGGGDDQGAVGGDCLEDDGWSLRMMFWNVCGWAKSGFGARVKSVDNLDMRVKVFGMFQLKLHRYGFGPIIRFPIFQCRYRSDIPVFP